MRTCTGDDQRTSQISHGLRRHSVKLRSKKERPLSDKPEPVIALFDSALPAEWAARRLSGWMRSDPFGQLEAMGILAKAGDGTVSMQKVGPRQTWKGAGIGLLTGALTASAVGELTMLQGLAAGAAGGGAAGSLFRRNPRLSHETRSRIASQLSPGGAAVVAVVPPRQAAAVTEKLVEYGGAPDGAGTTPVPEPAPAG
jgi:hypothetical protein